MNPRNRWHKYEPNGSGTGHCDRCTLPEKDTVHLRPEEIAPPFTITYESGMLTKAIEKLEHEATPVYHDAYPNDFTVTNEAREEGIRHMLRALGEDPSREGLKDTPRRVVKAWGELCAGYVMDPKKLLTVFDSEEYDEMICKGPIEYYSTCEHHLLPFWGEAWVAYIPKKKIIGLSKLARIVEIFARRLQNQERMTKQIADCLDGLISPLGVGVVVRGKHMCSMARGVRQPNAVMQTNSLKGVFRSEPAVRAEFLGQVR